MVFVSTLTVLQIEIFLREICFVWTLHSINFQTDTNLFFPDKHQSYIIPLTCVEILLMISVKVL